MGLASLFVRLLVIHDTSSCVQIAAGVFPPIKDYSTNLKGLVAEMLAVSAACIHARAKLHQPQRHVQCRSSCLATASRCSQPMTLHNAKGQCIYIRMHLTWGTRV